MKNNFINIEGQNIHFKTLGKGAPVILLHPSPNSSNMFVPMIEKLSNNLLVIAIDTPGYGQSQPLAANFKTMTDYTLILKKLFKKLGLEKLAIYGSATGSQIGVRYALENTEQVSHLFLDNAAHFSDELRNEILKEYFPDLTPQIDGSHLATMWKIVSRLFRYFPWYKNSPEFALNVPLPSTAMLHFIAKDFLAAGKNYDVAYKIAFEHERAEYVQLLKVPTTIFDWEASIIRPYTDQLLSYSFPFNVGVESIPADRNQRLERITDSISSKIKNDKVGDILDFEEVSFRNQKIDLKNYPSIDPDDNGEYLLEAWNFLVEKNKNDTAEMIHMKLNDWMKYV